MNTDYKLPEKGTKEYLRRKKKFENIQKKKKSLKKENQHPEIKKKVDFSFSSGSNLYIEGNSMSKSAALQKMYDNYYHNLGKGGYSRGVIRESQLGRTEKCRNCQDKNNYRF